MNKLSAFNVFCIKAIKKLKEQISYGLAFSFFKKEINIKILASLFSNNFNIAEKVLLVCDLEASPTQEAHATVLLCTNACMRVHQ